MLFITYTFDIFLYIYSFMYTSRIDFLKASEDDFRAGIFRIKKFRIKKKINYFQCLEIHWNVHFLFLNKCQHRG